MQEGFVKKKIFPAFLFLDIPWAILYTTLIVRIGGVYPYFNSGILKIQRISGEFTE